MFASVEAYYSLLDTVDGSERKFALELSDAIEDGLFARQHEIAQVSHVRRLEVVVPPPFTVLKNQGVCELIVVVCVRRDVDVVLGDES
ncbi:MAG: hypothetical protein NPIRA05_19700 [Nitrospirales bacterium]|nr:MAG: hypothetical protein NPIRA05_19700 [Nitrospirales bacterium]